jgi:hypothetical protein
MHPDRHPDPVENKEKQHTSIHISIINNDKLPHYSAKIGVLQDE